MVRSSPTHIVVIGAGAAGLMIARELGRAGKRVTLLEARDRCGGRIDPLSSAQFGYPAEGGAEFVHGEAPVTRSLLREAGISLLPIEGTQRTVMDGKLSTKGSLEIYEANLQTALKELDDDLTVAEFLRRHFAGAEHDHLRRSVERMVEGYDAADPERASMLALRDEWMGEGRRTQVRIAGGYGSLIDFLVARCRSDGVAIYFNSVVNAIASGRDLSSNSLRQRCRSQMRCRSSHRTPASSERYLASSGGTRAGRGSRGYWVRQRHKDSDAIPDSLVARRANASRRPDVSAFGSKDSGMVDPVSR